jgi:hypothetical protein
MAPRARFELATLRLTAECSTIELPGSSRHSPRHMANRKSVNEPSQGVNAGRGLEVSNLRCRQENFCGGQRELLKPLRGCVVADEVLENGEHVLAVLDDPLEQRPELRLADGFLIPLGENGGGNLNVLSKLVRRMPAQKQSVKKRGFALRELELLQRLLQRVGHRRHI